MPRVLPSSQCLLLDAIEYYAHSTFLEDSTKDDILFAAEQLERLCQVAFASNDLAKENSRIWNRLLMVMLIQNVCTRNTSLVLSEHGNGENNYDPNAMIHMEPSAWEEVLENLETCRTSLIKANATSPHCPTVDEDEMAQLPMFHEIYQDVHDLISCHVAISRLRYSLGEQLSFSEEDSNITFNDMVLMTKRNKHQDFSSILDDFVDHLPKAFSQTDLVSRLRKDVLKFSPRRASPTASPTNTSTSPNTNITMVKKILANVTEMLQAPDKPYSYIQVQHKCKTLCRTWNESILGTPVLAQLGYCGDKTNTSLGMNTSSAMMTMMGETDATGDDAKTVSSWGMDDDEARERQDIALAELKSVQKDDDDEDDVSDYQTADDDDDEDNNNNSSKTHPTKSHEHVNEMHALEIRPRENWREEFRLIDKLRTDDEGLGEEETEQKGKDSKSRDESRRRRRRRPQPSSTSKYFDSSDSDCDNDQQITTTKTKLSGAELMKRRRRTQDDRRRLLKGTSPWKTAVTNPVLVAAARQRRARIRQRREGQSSPGSRRRVNGHGAAAAADDEFDLNTDRASGSAANCDAAADTNQQRLKKRSKAVASRAASKAKLSISSPTSTASSSPFKKRKTNLISRGSSSTLGDDSSEDDETNLPLLLRKCLKAPPPKLPTYAEEILRRRCRQEHEQVLQQPQHPRRGRYTKTIE